MSGLRLSKTDIFLSKKEVKVLVKVILLCVLVVLVKYAIAG